MKQTFSDLLVAVFAFVAFSAATSTSAYAYLDGETVSMVLQAVIGAIASILLFGKMCCTKLKSIVKRQQG